MICYYDAIMTIFHLWFECCDMSGGYGSECVWRGEEYRYYLLDVIAEG